MNVKEKFISEMNAEGMTKVRAAEIFTRLMNIVTTDLMEIGEARLNGIGTLKVSQRKERRGYNPGTRGDMIIPAQQTIRFVAAKGMKEALN